MKPLTAKNQALVDGWRVMSFREIETPRGVAYEVDLVGPAGSVHVHNNGVGGADVFSGPIVVRDAVEAVEAAWEFADGAGGFDPTNPNQHGFVQALLLLAGF